LPVASCPLTELAPGNCRNTMRLTFAKEPDTHLREGIARLARVFA